MKKLPLSQGRYVLVDDSDYELLSKYKWSLLKGGRSNEALYAVRAKRSDDPEHYPNRILIHRQIMGFPDSAVDHIDGDGLDNRRENLRLASSSQNRTNQHRNLRTTGYRGVEYDHTRKTGQKFWRATIYHHGKRYRLGRFHTAEEAASAYNEKAIELHGEFATLNEL